MSYYVSVRIGGTIPRQAFDAVIAAARAEGASLEQCDQRVDDLLEGEPDAFETDLRSFLSSEGLLSFFTMDGSTPGIPAIEYACQTAGVPCLVLVDGDEETDVQARWWMPGMTEPGEAPANADYQPTMTVSEVEAAVAAGTLADLIAERTIPAIPPLVVEG